ncbi:6-O-methylguanine DNA methyltransferase [Kickxella alabastrina]|uniref:6-O-methylguanine DNA methyltransferase n=1 Tax=Kickxella alabastrina TaxID=61397 RepID=UPI00221F57D9|nr:6-O-methylguanine DNA methyltransferase [Kickxella alabastrina]KAI7834970.1 6-O-methylguanine DNA methyltransferase [Kickxella alabastrina]KAJ1947866.1 hypothetical protein GGF37_000013 [Kickxella alabastrina]
MKTTVVVAPTKSSHFVTKPCCNSHTRLFDSAMAPATIDDDIDTVIEYPETAQSRLEYISPKTGRPVTKFQYRVYDACRQIPKGSFTTYKAMADFLATGSRAVGNALSKNPFCPLPIPCHRVITSDYYIGGFSGDTTSLIFFKKAKLEKEGLRFDDKGFVAASLQQRQFFNEFCE